MKKIKLKFDPVPNDQPEEKWQAGTPYLSGIAKLNIRTPAGHTENYFEAFANTIAILVCV